MKFTKLTPEQNQRLKAIIILLSSFGYPRPPRKYTVGWKSTAWKSHFDILSQVVQTYFPLTDHGIIRETRDNSPLKWAKVVKFWRDEMEKQGLTLPASWK